MPEPSRSALADSRSPFLRHGAEQPVNWLPWGDVAFERAKRQNRPILLDIGAVWCHWCHVMDHESYEDAETAALINELYVPVKVDRDERPDVDARYQRAVQALAGQAGWPLTAFLTPDGEAFYGGTYFPPDDRYGRPSFRRVLREVARVWTEQRERALEAAGSVRQRLEEAARGETEAGELSGALVESAADAFAELFDFRHGGFGRQPKFPNAGALDLLLDRWLDTGTDWAGRIVAETLEAMGRGGIFDQLGGGFHRYSTDARWLVPHFEKMAYDNGVLLAVYARAWAVWRRPEDRRVAEGILDYYGDVAPHMLAEGGFPASQDADVGPHDDGDYWTWTADEIREALEDERAAEAAVLRYGLDQTAGGMPTNPDRHVLFLARSPAEVGARLGLEEEDAERLLAGVPPRLKGARDRRARPYVDETLYAGWVALVAAGFLAAARHLERPDAAAAAVRALERVWREGFEEGRGVRHRLGDREAGTYLEDQAHVLQALVDAFEYTQERAWLERARTLADVMLARFRDPSSGGLTDRPREADSPAAILTLPHLPIADQPEPSGNGTGALALLRLAALLEQPAYRDSAIGILEAFAGSAARMSTATATYVRAVDWATSPVTTVVVVGDDAAEPLFRAALAAHRPRTVLRRVSPAEVDEAELPEAVRAMLTGESPRAYVCAGQTCAAPVSDPTELAELLKNFRG